MAIDPSEQLRELDATMTSIEKVLDVTIAREVETLVALGQLVRLSPGDVYALIEDVIGSVRRALTPKT